MHLGQNFKICNQESPALQRQDSTEYRFFDQPTPPISSQQSFSQISLRGTCKWFRHMGAQTEDLAIEDCEQFCAPIDDPLQPVLPTAANTNTPEGMESSNHITTFLTQPVGHTPQFNGPRRHVFLNEMDLGQKRKATNAFPDEATNFCRMRLSLRPPWRT